MRKKMRLTVSNCVVLFVLSWCLGIFVVYYLFEVGGSDKNVQVTSNNQVSGENLQFQHNMISKRFALRHPASSQSLSKQNNRLPSLSVDKNSSLSSTIEEAIHIYLDWPIDDRFFTVDNYKALESILNVYPNAIVRCQLVAPREAYVHKIGNTLSIMQFIKYKKRQYNINVVPINPRQKSRTSFVGEKYREKWFNECCLSCNAECRATDRTQPYHLLNYIRLSNLYNNGGIFSDFSFFFLGKITNTEARQGFYLNSYCGNRQQLEPWLHVQDKETDGGDQDDKSGKSVVSNKSYRPECVTSTLLVFSTPESPIILCMLSKYNDADFLSCINSDVVYGGALCIKNAFVDCFQQSKVKNYLETDNVDSGSEHTKYNNNKSMLPVISSSVAAAAEDVIASATTTAAAAVGLSWLVKGSSTADSASLRSDSSLTSDADIGTTKEVTSKSSPIDVSYGGIDNTNANTISSISSSSGVLETFEDNPYRASNMLRVYTNWTISENRRVLWLGSIAWSGTGWNHYPYPNGTLLSAAVQTIKLKDVTESTGSSSSSSSALIHNSSTTATTMPGGKICKVSSTCSHYYGGTTNVVVAAAVAAKNSNNEDINSKMSRSRSNGGIDNSILPPSVSGSSIGSLSCSPTVVIAGFTKSASSFLFQALSNHPSILPALRGSQYKEALCYSNNNKRKKNQQQQLQRDPRNKSNNPPHQQQQRPWCYPFIEESEPFLSMDGSVGGYNIDSTVPASLKLDNPNVKVLFVVRNPVERLYSSYKFSYIHTYHKFGTFDDFVMSGMNIGNKFGELRRMITNGSTDMNAIISSFYDKQFTTINNSSNNSSNSGALGSLFMHSIYAPAVMHYMNILEDNHRNAASSSLPEAAISSTPLQQQQQQHVKVITSEDLDMSDPVRVYETLNSIFAFLGVCAVPITDLVPALPSRNTVPLAHQMTQDMYSKLTKFFVPFNNLLMNITGLNLTHWNDKKPPVKLPKFSLSTNKSLPLLWFEEELLTIKTTHNKQILFAADLMPHLLPQRKSEEDSSYNTTLGMLNTF